MPSTCSSTVQNLISIGIMLPGGLLSLLGGGFVADWLMGMRDPRTMNFSEHQAGCFLAILCVMGLWLFVCFPIMRLVLWLFCDKPFGFN
jgi:hypothetical protein